MALAQPKLSVRERNKVRLRSALLDAVLDLFLDADQTALNIEAIARHVGCAKATVYVYFPGGLNEMLCAIYEEISAEVTAKAIQQRDTMQTPHDRIMALAAVLLDMSARPRRGKFYAQLNPELSPALQPVLGQSSAQFSEMIATDLKPAAEGDTKTLAILLVGTLREASVRIAKDPALRDGLRKGVSQLVTGLIETGQRRNGAEDER